MASNWSRDLGSDRSLGRLSCSLQELSSSPFLHPGIVSDVPGRLSSSSSLAARGRGDACQRSLRNRPRSGSRLLQSSFPGGESLWRLETHDRSLSPERVRPADSVQDGNGRFCTVICQRGGFSSFLGSRLPSDAHSPVASEGSLVPRVRPSLSSSVSATGSKTGSVSVDGEGPSVDGGLIRDTCSGSSPVFGRVLFRVGRSPYRSTCVHGVVRPGEVAAHQSSRNEGSFLKPSGIPRRCHRPSRDCDV